VEHEHHAFGWDEPLHHDQQCDPDAVIERDPVRRVGETGFRRRDELDFGGVVGAFPAGPR
jgi:hypothetical protein